MPISNKCSMKDKKHIIRVKVGSTFFGSQEMRNTEKIVNFQQLLLQDITITRIYVCLQNPNIWIVCLKKIIHQQAFIQTLLSTAVFPPKFSLLFAQLSVSIFLEFRSADCCKMHFSWIFQSFIWSFEETLTGNIHTSFLCACF